MDDVFLVDDSQRDDIDQTVLVEAALEVDVAGEVGNANRISVGTDPVHDPARDVALMRCKVFASAEAQWIGHRNDLGTHAEDVANDPADSGRRAFEGNDLRWMVVRLVRDDDRVALAVVRAKMQNSGIPPGPRITRGPLVGRFFRKRRLDL